MRREIVGALIGSTVTNRLPDIIEAAGAGRIRRFLTKQEMEYMASCGLGSKWKVMAQSPVLFIFDDETGDVFLVEQDD